MTDAKNVNGSYVIDCSRTLSQSAAIGAKKSLADYKITACVKEIYLLGVVYKVLNRKTLSGETFCFPEKSLLYFTSC